MKLWNCTKKLFWTRNISNVIKFSTEAKENLIYVDSQKINYLKVGKGPKNIVCFPGAFGTIWTDFKPQIEGLNKDEFTIFVWEQPGHGKSRPPERIYNSKFLHEDADVGYNFVKALGLKSVSLLGWSDGGSSAIILAAKYPEVVDKLIVSGAFSHMTNDDFERFEKIQDLDSWSDNVRAPLLKFYGEKVLRDMIKVVLEAKRDIRDEGGDISTSLLEHIKCPTLILHGARDTMIVPDHATYLSDKIKQAKLHIFPEGKHNIHSRYADEFNAIITRFFKEDN